MVAQRQPVDRVIDLVVGLPVATVVAAARSFPLMRQASRLGLHAVSRRARHALGSGQLDPTAAAVPRTVDVPADQPIGSPAPATGARTLPVDPPATSVLPIDDYDHLAARQVVDRLSTLTATELAQIDGYERAHRHRQTVLGRIAQLQS